ncbi:MAG: tetratricopeptide repeat protein [Candidatus Caldipriscus sp.]
MRRIVLIIILVIIGALIGGSVGVGVAYYLIMQKLEKKLENTKAQTQPEAPQVKVDTVVKVIQEVKVVPTVQGKKSSDTNATQTLDLQTSQPQPETQNQPVILPQQPQQIQQPQLSLPQGQTRVSQSLPELKAPTIDLGSSNLSGNVSLQRPPTPSTSMPDINPTLSGGGLSIVMETLKEEDVRKVYYEQGNIAKAEKMVNDALAKNPNDQVAKKYARIIKLEKNALSLEAQGDIEGAKRVWKEILLIDPNHPRAKAKAQ